MEDIMEIKIDRNEIYRSISRVQSIIEKRSNMPILSMVLLRGNGSHLLISATDLEISFQQKIPAEVIEEGSITISGRKLFEILKESKSPTIHIKERENNWTFLSDGKARYNLAGLPSDEYPVLVQPEDVSTISIRGEILAEMVNKTIFSVTMEEAGFKLSGVFAERVERDGKTLLRMVSTDGHRLSLIDKEVEDIDTIKLDGGVMIPKKGMVEVGRLALESETVQIGFKDNNCIARNENTTILVRLLESKFPDYNAVIPRKTMSFTKIGRDEMLEGMKKMVILSSESYRGVKVTLESDRLELVSINPDIGDAQEVIEVDYKHERLEAGFNPRYFIDALQAMESDRIEIGFVDNSSPCLIRGEQDEGFLGLIMPMRI
ncbi:MAG: DNA polymerase III subunit beta [Deltaproteobacteria bacterium]|nr:DNA polymerase III subunit beta [Deltaproteobacteria bacterium]